MANSGRASFDDFVHVAGGRLVDGRGDPVLLRGVGLGNWLLPEGYMWKFEPSGPQSPRQIEALIDDLVGPRRAHEFWRRFRDTFITEADIARISSEGMNHVRLPINSRVVIDDGGRLLEDGFFLIDRLIDWCRAHRLWVVLDLHGAPGGQTGTNIDDSPRGAPELFSEARYRDLTISLWRALATRYRDEPVVAAYDLLNEPIPDEYQHTYADQLVDLYVDLTAAIREIDARHVISYEGSHWASNWSIFDEVWDPNALLQFHKYWNPPDRPSIQRFLDTGTRLGLPIYMGEGGENNLDWLQTAFQLYEDCGISWNFWPWKKIDTRTSPCSIDPPSGWGRIADYAAGIADKPDGDDAWHILTRLLNAMPLACCTYRSEVMSALLRRVPLTMPATGFGFRGAGVSYKTTAPTPLRGFRSDDQVTIRHAGGIEPPELDFHHTGGAPRDVDDELLVSLGPGDWVRYDINVRDPAQLDIVVELGAVRTRQPDQAPLELRIDGTAIDTRLGEDGSTVSAATNGIVLVGRHSVRLTGLARETLVRSVTAIPSASTSADRVLLAHPHATA